MYCTYTMFFFFNDTATTEIYTLSLHDALPISRDVEQEIGAVPRGPTGEVRARRLEADRDREANRAGGGGTRSEEHTSELQSQSNIVCRLLLEKKKDSITFPFVSHISTTPLHKI